VGLQWGGGKTAALQKTVRRPIEPVKRNSVDGIGGSIWVSFGSVVSGKGAGLKTVDDFGDAVEVGSVALRETTRLP
jgi:hypothetical protein